MAYVRGFFISGCIALAGAGGGVIAMNLSTSSPRLMTAGVISALVGIIGGGVGLAMGMRQG
jgi:hypothetical protein